MKFDSYVSKEMHSDEIREFEEELEVNSEFLTAFTEYKKTIEGIRAYHFKKDVETMSSSYDNDQKKSRRWIYATIGIAASFILLVGINLVLNRDEPSDLELFEKYFDPSPSYHVARGNNQTIDQAFILYTRGDYEGAIKEFKKIEKVDRADNIQFYNGISYLALGNSRLAIEKLILVSDSSVYYNPTLWYKGLAYLRLKDYEKAVEYLQLVDKESSKSNEAKELLDILTNKSID